MTDNIIEDEIVDTAGFYRVDQEMLYFAPNFIYAPDYTLLKEEKDSYTYPTSGGWIWFDTENDAKLHFGIVDEVEEKEGE